MTSPDKRDNRSARRAFAAAGLSISAIVAAGFGMKYIVDNMDSNSQSAVNRLISAPKDSYDQTKRRILSSLDTNNPTARRALAEMEDSGCSVDQVIYNPRPEQVVAARKGLPVGDTPESYRFEITCVSR